MKNLKLILALSVLVVLASACRTSDYRKSNYQSVSFIPYFGYPDCVRLKNKSTEVIISPHVGGRVLAYSYDGKNSIYLDPKQNGWRYDGKTGIIIYGGNFDIGPEHTVPKHDDIFLGKWSFEITGERAIRLTSRKDRNSDLKVTREFKLDKNTSKLTVKQTIFNLSNVTRACCYWGRSCAVGDGIFLCPVTEHSRFPHKYLLHFISRVENKPEDPNVIVRDEFVKVVGQPAAQKMEFDSKAGWFCYLMKNNLIFIKRFPIYSDRVYGEVSGATVSVYYYKQVFCELEPLGPLEILKPGEQASFTVEWWLAPYKFPVNHDALNLRNVTRIVKNTMVK